MLLTYGILQNFIGDQSNPAALQHQIQAHSGIRAKPLHLPQLFIEGDSFQMKPADGHLPNRPVSPQRSSQVVTWRYP